MSIVRVFETLVTRMEVYVDWADGDDGPDELVLFLRDRDASSGEEIRLQLVDLHEVIESMTNFQTSMADRAYLNNMARFASTKRQREKEDE